MGTLAVGTECDARAHRLSAVRPEVVVRDHPDPKMGRRAR